TKPFTLAIPSPPSAVISKHPLCILYLYLQVLRSYSLFSCSVHKQIILVSISKTVTKNNSMKKSGGSSTKQDKYTGIIQVYYFKIMRAG
ncbi:MAG TPA: hypothetical protein VE548_02745, partial [Nitrososphaeraceae archaeon]|nr:hypothetical protein [Nitrososphaeraceae archaeon]